MINENSDKVMKKLLKSLLNRYQKQVKNSIKGSEFVFDDAHLLYYKCHKININRGGSYTVSSDWIKNKNVTINPISKTNNK